MARFFLMLDGVRILTLDDLKAHFKPLDALDRFRSGALQRWLAEQHLNDLLANVKAIGDNLSDDETIRLLGVVLGIEKKTEESLAELDEELCGDLTYEEMESLFAGDQGEKNIARLTELAKEGNEDAQLKLSFLFAHGIGVREDKTKAFHWCLRAAESGNAFAQTQIGEWYWYRAYPNGVGNQETQNNLHQAFSWFQKAAEQGDADGRYHLGRCFFYGDGVDEDKVKAVELFQLAADQGVPDAFDMLGQCYKGGYGIREDLKKAFALFQKAAELGSAPGRYHLGKCFFYGDGVNENNDEAAKWLQLAADNPSGVDEPLGYEAGACYYLLGFCYKNGYGVDEDAETAVKWFRKAGELGDPDGMIDLAKSLFSGQGVTRNEEEAVQNLRNAVECGWPEAKALLAFCYYFGIGVDEDREKSFTLASEAVEEDEPMGQTILGICYMNGDGVEMDETKGIDLLRKAAKEDEPIATISLAMHCLMAEGPDVDTGFKLLRIGVEEMQQNRMYDGVSFDGLAPESLLGKCYQYGIGVAKDIRKAAKWYKIAADKGDENAAKEYRKCLG